MIRAFTILIFLAPIEAAYAVPAPALDEAVFHGGGCRKSSPPGQCCHMDRKRGEVHCH